VLDSYTLESLRSARHEMACCLTETELPTEFSCIVIENAFARGRYHPHYRLCPIYIPESRHDLTVEFRRDGKKMLGPFAAASRRYIVSHQVSLVARQL